MALSVPFALRYEFAVKASAADVFALLSDVPASASHFPKVHKLVDMGGHVYRWELEKVGTAQLGIQTVYASKYLSNKRKGTVTWTAVKGVGNGQVAGSWTLTRKQRATQLQLVLEGTIILPLPGWMKMIVVPIVARENDKLVRKYIANLIQRFGGEA